MLKNIDVSFWAADTMPVAIEGQLGYTTETVPIRGGTRRYHWLRFLRWGVELAIATPYGKIGGSTNEKSGGQTEPPA